MIGVLNQRKSNVLSALLRSSGLLVGKILAPGKVVLQLSLVPLQSYSINRNIQSSFMYRLATFHSLYWSEDWYSSCKCGSWRNHSSTATTRSPSQGKQESALARADQCRGAAEISEYIIYFWRLSRSCTSYVVFFCLEHWGHWGSIIFSRSLVWGMLRHHYGMTSLFSLPH